MYLATGRIEEVANHVRGALALSRRLGARAVEARALYPAGEIASTGGAEDPGVEVAVDYHRQALALAEPRGMRSLVAHCHSGLSKLHLRSGNLELGQEHVTIATAMYREMSMTYWEMRQLG